MQNEQADGRRRSAESETGRFSLRSLFVLVTVCAVLATLASILLRAMQQRDMDFASGYTLVGTAAMLPPFGALIAYMVYGRIRWAVLVFVLSVPLGVVIGGLIAANQSVLVLVIIVTCSASLACIGLRLWLMRPVRQDVSSNWWDSDADAGK